MRKLVLGVLLRRINYSRYSNRPGCWGALDFISPQCARLERFASLMKAHRFYPRRLKRRVKSTLAAGGYKNVHPRDEDAKRDASYARRTSDDAHSRGAGDSVRFVQTRQGSSIKIQSMPDRSQLPRLDSIHGQTGGIQGASLNRGPNANLSKSPNVADCFELLGILLLLVFHLLNLPCWWSRLQKVLSSQVFQRIVQIGTIASYFGVVAAADGLHHDAGLFHCMAQCSLFAILRENLYPLTMISMLTLAIANIILREDSAPSARFWSMIDQIVWIPAAALYYKMRIWRPPLAQLTLVALIFIASFVVGIFQPGVEGFFTFFPMSFSLVAVAVASLPDIITAVAVILASISSFLQGLSRENLRHVPEDDHV